MATEILLLKIGFSMEGSDAAGALTGGQAQTFGQTAVFSERRRLLDKSTGIGHAC